MYHNSGLGYTSIWTVNTLDSSVIRTPVVTRGSRVHLPIQSYIIFSFPLHFVPLNTPEHAGEFPTSGKFFINLWCVSSGVKEECTGLGYMDPGYRLR